MDKPDLAVRYEEVAALCQEFDPSITCAIQDARDFGEVPGRIVVFLNMPEDMWDTHARLRELSNRLCRLDFVARVFCLVAGPPLGPGALE